MNKHRGMKLHYYVRSGILLGLTTYIFYLVQTDKLHYYIVPRMAPFMMLSVIALYLLALYCIYLAWQGKSTSQHTHKHGEACSCQHEVPRSRIKSVLLYIIFMVPLLLGFLMPDQLMGSDIAAVKGMNLSASNGTSFQQTKVSELNNASDDLKSNVETSPVAGESSGLTAENERDTKGTLEANSKVGVIEEQEEMAEGGLAVHEEAPMSDTGSGDSTTNMNTVTVIGKDDMNNGASISTSDTSTEEESFEALFASDQYSVELAELGKLLYKKDVIIVKEEGFLETLTTLDLYRNNFIGKTIQISGFVYREADMSPDTFVVSRMAMQCCSADASPYGFLVQWDNANTLEKDKWIEVEGTFGLTEYNDIEIVQLNATKVIGIEAPNDPYVYPYFDDFINLAAE